jgi:hypothetical protein
MENFYNALFADGTSHTYFSIWVYYISDTLKSVFLDGPLDATFKGGGTYNDKFYCFIEDFSIPNKRSYKVMTINRNPEGLITGDSIKVEKELDVSQEDTLEINQYAVLYKNLMIITITNKNNLSNIIKTIYYYNIDTKEFKKMFQYSQNDYFLTSSLNEYDGIYYLVLLSLKGTQFRLTWFRNDDFANQPEKWEQCQDRYVIYPLYESDSTYVVKVEDKYLNTLNKILYLTKKKDSRVNEIEQKSYVYISNPMPNPAGSNTRFNVTYPVNQDINTMQISVCNILGQIVAVGSSFEVTPINDHAVEINWTIGSLPRGVYLINVKIGSEVGTKSIVIN